MAMQNSSHMRKEECHISGFRKSRKILDKLENTGTQGLFKNAVYITGVILCRRIFEVILCKSNWKGRENVGDNLLQDILYMSVWNEGGMSRNTTIKITGISFNNLGILPLIQNCQNSINECYNSNRTCQMRCKTRIHLEVCVHTVTYTPIARQRLGKHFPTTTNKQATIV
jgi:hypothetical protein